MTHTERHIRVRSIYGGRDQAHARVEAETLGELVEMFYVVIDLGTVLGFLKASPSHLVSFC